MRMLQWVCGVSLTDKVPSVEIWERMGSEAATEFVKRNHLRCLEDVFWNNSGDWVNRSCMRL